MHSGFSRRRDEARRAAGQGLGAAAMTGRRRWYYAVVLMGCPTALAVALWAIFHDWSWRLEAAAGFGAYFMALVVWLAVLATRRLRQDHARMRAEHNATAVDLASRQIILDEQTWMYKNGEL